LEERANQMFGGYVIKVNYCTKSTSQQLASKDSPSEVRGRDRKDH